MAARSVHMRALEQAPRTQLTTCRNERKFATHSTRTHDCVRCKYIRNFISFWLYELYTELVWPHVKCKRNHITLLGMTLFIPQAVFARTLCIFTWHDSGCHYIANTTIWKHFLAIIYDKLCTMFGAMFVRSTPSPQFLSFKIQRTRFAVVESSCNINVTYWFICCPIYFPNDETVPCHLLGNVFWIITHAVAATTAAIVGTELSYGVLPSNES